MEINEVLAIAGGDADLTLRRFSGNAALLARFMKKFPDDQSFKQLTAAMEEKDYKTAEKAAHTLKGTSGSLGFQKLFKSSDDLVICLRNGGEEADMLYVSVQQAYDAVIAALSQLD